MNLKMGLFTSVHDVHGPDPHVLDIIVQNHFEFWIAQVK